MRSIAAAALACSLIGVAGTARADYTYSYTGLPSLFSDGTQPGLHMDFTFDTALGANETWLVDSTQHLVSWTMSQPEAGVAITQASAAGIAPGSEYAPLFVFETDAHGAIWSWYATAYNVTDGAWTSMGLSLSGPAIDNTPYSCFPCEFDLAISPTGFAEALGSGTWSGPTLPVPEPSPALMLLAGMAVVTLVKRRAA